MLEGKTVLVTGATGLIGSNLVTFLLSETKAKVIALGRNTKKLNHLFEGQISNRRLSVMVKDISLPFEGFGEPIDLIFHAASPTSGAIIREKPVDVIVPNIIGAKNCLDYLHEQEMKNRVKGRLVLFSSATVYSNLSDSDRIVAEADTTVADPLDGKNAPYSESKRMTEVMARAYYAQYGVDSVIVRLGYLYGYSFFQPRTAFYEFINKALAGEDIVIGSSGIARRDNIYVDDAIKGLLAISQKGASAEAYNISSNGEKNNFLPADEMAAIVAQACNEILGTRVRVTYSQPQEGARLPGMLLDNHKAKALGWSVNMSIETGIRETVLRYMQHGFH